MSIPVEKMIPAKIKDITTAVPRSGWITTREAKTNVNIPVIIISFFKFFNEIILPEISIIESFAISEGWNWKLPISIHLLTPLPLNNSKNSKNKQKEYNIGDKAKYNFNGIVIAMRKMDKDIIKYTMCRMKTFILSG